MKADEIRVTYPQIREILKKENHEYDYLLRFYTDLIGFPVITSTFSKLSADEKDSLNEYIRLLKERLEKVLPTIQGKEY